MWLNNILKRRTSLFTKLSIIYCSTLIRLYQSVLFREPNVQKKSFIFIPMSQVSNFYSFFLCQRGKGIVVRVHVLTTLTNRGSHMLYKPIVSPILVWVKKCRTAELIQRWTMPLCHAIGAGLIPVTHSVFIQTEKAANIQQEYSENIAIHVIIKFVVPMSRNLLRYRYKLALDGRCRLCHLTIVLK